MTVLSSMTGYAQGVSQSSGDIVIELKTINSRFLDIHCKLPVGCEKFEAGIVKLIRSKLSRGRVDVFLRRVSEKTLSQKINFDSELFNQTVNLIVSQFKNDNLKPEDKVKITAATLLERKEFLSFEQTLSEDEVSEASVLEALDLALTNLVQMRQTEGANLKNALVGYISDIKDISAKILPFANEAVSKFSQKLQNKISELQLTIPAERLALEVALLAEKADVSEEIDRLGSHIGQFEQTLKDGGEVGRKLDFLTQEMNREFNTTGSKSQSAEVTTLVIEAKSTLEKIREQIQNIE